MLNLYLGWLLLLTAALLVWPAVTLARNISKAKRTGLPYALTPIHELEVWAFITDAILRWYYHEHLLVGEGWPGWARFMVKDWHYEDKGRAHGEYGPVFLVVSAGGIICYTAEADVSLSIVTRRRAFVKLADKMKMLEPFGPNVVSTDGDTWRSHIRITLPSFGEQVQDIVWEETKRQADMLCQTWSKAGNADIRANIYQLTMNTMCLASFGWRVDWATGGESDIPAGHKISLVQAATNLVLQLPLILLLPKWLLRVLPNQPAYVACCEFEQYMDEFLARERTALTQRAPGTERRANLLTSLLRASCEPAAGGEPPASDGRAGLTDQEIKGNIFIFLLAGYDTTANTIIYTCIVLALYQDMQEKARQEVDAIYAQLGPGRGDDQELSYSEHFHSFRYLLAVMYEVMRVFPTVLPITRVAESDQPLTVPSRPGGDKAKAVLPAGTICVVNITGTHFSEANWPAAHIIEPRRWLARDPNRFDPLHVGPPRSEAGAGEEEEDGEGEAGGAAAAIPGHRRGTFMTFNEGPRACLGRNFARAEFLAFFSRLLRSYRLELGGDVSGAALEWALRCRTGGSPVTLTLPENVKLRLVPRDSS